MKPRPGRSRAERVGVVRKTRIEAFPEGEVFPFCYQEIASRYGREVLERDSVAQELATPDQIRAITEGLDAVWGYQASFENMRSIMDYFAWSRELVTDELAKLRYEASQREGLLKDNPDLEIHLSYDEKARTIIIEDSGIGIPPQEREKVFSKFFLQFID